MVKTLRDYDIPYLARGTLTSVGEVVKTGRMIRKALEKQRAGLGFCLVEVLSPCPTNWHMTPRKALAFMREQQERYYEVGEFIDKGGV